MIKRTIVIESPCVLRIKHKQLVIEREEEVVGTVPVEDIGLLLIENTQVLYSHHALISVIENNGAVVLAGIDHNPVGLILPLESNTLQSERFRVQINASVPTLKRLWQQIIQSKIRNQSRLLNNIGITDKRLPILAQKVKSGDPENIEAQASRHYWLLLFGRNFRRDRFLGCPNNYLNYGYIILRAATARSLVGSGLLPTLGIHHHNRYNAYCLADDMMEPYRAFVDKAVYELLKQYGKNDDITKEMKTKLLQVLESEVDMNGIKYPLMSALHQSTASLYRCLSGIQKEIEFPTLWEKSANTE
ncbi:MAG: type II CRISPR-associated endonuclease Cas1 [Nitrospirae bacterium]|nr:type II CRISPR-associated endonuclease Cas1 [Nitrospirota bacterium]